MLKLDYSRSLALLNLLRTTFPTGQLDTRRCRFELYENEHLLLRFRYPLCLTLNMTDRDISATSQPNYAILLLRMGNAALATVENGRIRQHKVFTAYVSRKKQGKAQYHYLKSKGKSRLGSRIRLANTTRFTEEVIQWMHSHIDVNTGALLYQCPPTLWGLFHAAHPQPPFNKKDQRLRKIPYTLRQPRFAEIERIRPRMESGLLEWHEPAPAALRELIATLWDQ
ncbi:MAG: hypothetical protein D6677_00975 [Calditrichaeota bacterium]|nr:MAG: hypothetical protein D6677_00975 [Calditrichota bacterium]